MFITYSAINCRNRIWTYDLWIMNPMSLPDCSILLCRRSKPDLSCHITVITTFRLLTPVELPLSANLPLLQTTPRRVELLLQEWKSCVITTRLWGLIIYFSSGSMLKNLHQTSVSVRTCPKTEVYTLEIFSKWIRFTQIQSRLKLNYSDYTYSNLYPQSFTPLPRLE